MSSQLTVKPMTLKKGYKSHESAMHRLAALQEANKRRKVAAMVRRQLPGLVKLANAKRIS